ncbi:MAG: glycoside hydrolase family 2 TIM barrel-domain containing protein, partial [Lewinella sp.]
PCACAAFSHSFTGEVPPDSLRTRRLLDDWDYRESMTHDPAILTDIAAIPVTLPHTWNQWDAVDNNPGYRRDASWYSRPLRVTPRPDRRYLLYFEGANTKAEVYLNGERIGGHIGGYVGWEVDLSDHLAASGENELDVRVDNGYDPNVIPSQKSDFFIYGGLVRDVWLREVPATYVSDLRIRTPEVSADRALTVAQVKIAGQLPANTTLRGTVVDPATDRTVASGEASINDDGRATIEFSPIVEPNLWSPGSPNRYRVSVDLVNAEGEIVDRQEDMIGYRWYRFEEHGPFFLNGERLLLRGTHRHEEHAGYGMAMPDSLHRRDVELMKEMGVNFLRLGHYPQDPSVYEACDELGIIVWDELPWCRGGKGGEEWEANTERLLREQIVQNYNHPSVFFWSLGNEIYWLPDFPGGDDTTAMNTFLAHLNGVAHELDPGRLTAIRKYYAGADMVDVFSPSIWSGWYAGVYKNYGPTLEKQQPLYPRFLHMEYGGSSHVGRHTETPIDGDGLVDPDEWSEAVNQVNVENIASSGDWTENYIVDLFDWHLSVSETLDWFPGNAQWAFKDFGTPLRPENPIPYLNQKGLVDRAGQPKDAYYVFKSYWAEAPFTYIESHTWTERSGPEGRSREVNVFSNCDRVELFHNGTSLGMRTRKLGEFPAAGLTWDVSFTEGENRLTSTGYRNGEEVATDDLAVHYTYRKFGSADHVELTHRSLPNGNILVEAIMRDADGQRVLDYEDHLYFSADGAGKLLIDYGTPTRSQVIGMANGRAAIELQPGAGRTVIEARNQDFKGSYLVIPAETDTR